MEKDKLLKHQKWSTKKIMKQGNHDQRRDRMLFEKKARNTANKLESKKKGTKQYKTMDSAKN